MVMMTKEKGSDGKREGQRGRSDPEKESGLLRFLPVAAAASQNQNNHKMCLIFGVICGEETKMNLFERPFPLLRFNAVMFPSTVLHSQ